MHASRGVAAPPGAHRSEGWGSAALLPLRLDTPRRTGYGRTARGDVEGMLWKGGWGKLGGTGCVDGWDLGVGVERKPVDTGTVGTRECGMLRLPGCDRDGTPTPPLRVG